MFGKAVWAHTFSHGSWLPVEKSSTGYWFASHDLTYKALWFLSPWVPGVNIKILWGVPQDFLKFSPHIAHGTGESGLCGALNTLAPFKRTEWKSISCGQSSCTTLDTARKTWVTRLTRSMLGSQSDRRAVPEDLFFGRVKVRHIHIAEINVGLLCLRLLAGLPLCFWIYIYLYIFVDSSCSQIHAA